jgi:hypothetical protein
LTRQLVRRLTSSDILPEVVGLSWAGEGSRAFLESSLEEALHSLLLRLESLGQRCREMQDLEQEVMRLEDLLKVRPGFHVPCVIPNGTLFSMWCTTPCGLGQKLHNV